MFIEFRFKQIVAWDMDLELEVEFLRTIKVREIHDKMEK